MKLYLNILKIGFFTCMSSIEDLPVLILAYNRFDKFYRCINTLKDQGIKKVFISIDGPKNKFDLKNQDKINKFCIQNPLKLDIKINKFQYNNGCRLGPIKGITWFFNENKYGVVLEDDVLVSKKCMELFSYLLKDNFNKRNYMSISSFNEFTNKKVESIYSMPVWRSWAWASWSHKWNEHLIFSKKIRHYNLFQLYKLMPLALRSIETVKLVKASQLNLLDAWDYEFNFSHIVNNNSSLTMGGINCFVYGFDESSTHAVDINSTGINFNLFSEREFDIKKIDYNIHNINSLTSNKCGFFFSDKKFFDLIFDLIKGIYFSSIFRLRIIKRNMYFRL